MCIFSLRVLWCTSLIIVNLLWQLPFGATLVSRYEVSKPSMSLVFFLVRAQSTQTWYCCMGGNSTNNWHDIGWSCVASESLPFQHTQTHTHIHEESLRKGAPLTIRPSTITNASIYPNDLFIRTLSQMNYSIVPAVCVWECGVAWNSEQVFCPLSLFLFSILEHAWRQKIALRQTTEPSS